MGNQEKESLKSVDLSTLEAGRVLRIVTGLGESAFHYAFTVKTPDKWPIGTLEETNPNGNVISLEFMMQGSGLWTTRRENPCQVQNRAFTSGFWGLTLNTFMVGSPADDSSNRLVFDKPGQHITFLAFDN